MRFSNRQDIEAEAKAESKIASILIANQLLIQEKCGDAYFVQFLHRHELEISRKLYGTIHTYRI